MSPMESFQMDFSADSYCICNYKETKEYVYCTWPDKTAFRVLREKRFSAKRIFGTTHETVLDVCLITITNTRTCPLVVNEFIYSAV